jgi:hypothetical protein
MTTTNHDTWHCHLGHPGHDAYCRLLYSLHTSLIGQRGFQEKIDHKFG